MFNKLFSKKRTVYISKEQADALFSMYTDIMSWVESNREYQDVEKAENEANMVKEILDQTDFEFEYKTGF